MNAVTKVGRLALAILSGLVFTAIFYFALSGLQRSQIIPCTDIWASNLIVSLSLAFVLQLFIVPRIAPHGNTSVLAVHASLILLALWLGLYPISPLGYSSGRVPILRGFEIIRTNRDSTLGADEVVSLTQGVAVGINPIMLPGDFECSWMSARGGALDDPARCDTAYVPPGEDFDILRLRIRSNCGLPDSTHQLRISILP